MSTEQDWAFHRPGPLHKPFVGFLWGPVIAATLLLLCLGTARAHSRDDPELDDWLMAQTNQNNGMCCDGEDVIALSDSEWRIRGNHYEVVFRGTWTPIESWMLTRSPENRMGSALLWSWQGHVQCFKPGTFY